MIGLVLAGGASRRMGVDKLWLPVDNSGKPMVVHVVETVLQVAAPTYVVHAPEAQGRFSTSLKSSVATSVRLLADETAHQGPLAALAHALGHISMVPEDAFVIAPGDIPGLCKRVLASALTTLLANDDLDAALITRDNRLQPLLGAYRGTMIRPLLTAVEQGESRLLRVLNEMSVRRIGRVCDDKWLPAWSQPVHTPLEYEAWRKEAGLDAPGDTC